MILTQKLFKMRYAVDNAVQEPVIVHASDMDHADTAVLMHAAEQPGYEGGAVRILAATEIDLESL